MYLWGRDGGWIELHGFCAGWRPHDFTKDGMLYIRRCHRIFVASGEMNPGRYDMSRLRGGSTDEIILVDRLREMGRARTWHRLAHRKILSATARRTTAGLPRHTDNSR
jgi:hypothetical protein